MRNKSPTESWLPRDPVPPFDAGRSRYPAGLVARAADFWRRLGDDERQAVVAAARVTTDLARLGAPPAILGLAARVIEDEIRHVEVCARVLDSLGMAPAETAPPTPAETARAARDIVPVTGEVESRAARTLIARFTVGEPLWAAHFAAARANAREPIIAWAYTELLRDEARHGAFGARAGAWVIRAWPPARRQSLWPDCLAEMESFERRAGAATIAVAHHQQRRDTAAEALGLITAQTSCSAVNASIPRSVLPHLTALGVIPPAGDSPALLQ